MARRPYGVRLQAEGKQKFETDMRDAARSGQQAFERVARASQRPTAGMRTLNALSGELRGRLEGVAATAPAISRLSGALGPIGLGLAAAAGSAVLLGRQARNAAREIAAIGDAADRAGIEAGLFEGLRAALVLEGQSENGLEQAVAALNRRLGEARQGGRGAIDTFAAVGVSLDDLANGGATTEDILFRVSDGLAAIEDPARRAAISQQLFSETGRALTLVLDDGSEALRRQIAEAEKLGLTYGGEVIRNAQQLNAAFERQSRIIDTQLKRAFITAGPAVESLGESMAEIIPIIATVIATAAAGFNELTALIGLAERPIRVQLQSNIAELRQVQDEIANRAQGNRPTSLDVFADAIAVIAPSARPFAGESDEALNRLQEELTARNRELSDALAAQDNLLNRPPPVIPEIEIPSISRGGGGRGGPREDRTAEQLLERLRERVELQTQEIELLGLGERESVVREAAFERERQLRELLNAAAREGTTISADQVAAARAEIDAIEANTVAIFDKTRAIEEQARAAEDAARASEEWNRSLQDTISSIVDLGLNARSSTDFLRGLLQILGSLIEQGVQGQGVLGGVLPQLISGIAGAFGGGSGVASFAGAGLGGGVDFGSFAAGLTFARGGVVSGGNVVPFARGGVLNGPTMFPLSGGRIGLAGEAGEEGLFPITRDRSGRMAVSAVGGGAPVNVTINSPDVDSFRRSKSQIDGALARAVGRARGRQL